METITKKRFKELVYSNVYTGGGIRINAMFVDWKERFGYKFMVYGNVKDISKKDLFNVLYDWVNNEIQPPYKVAYKYAETDDKRFKIQLSLR